MIRINFSINFAIKSISKSDMVYWVSVVISPHNTAYYGNPINISIFVIK